MIDDDDFGYLEQENPNSKMFSELFTDPIEQEMNFRDFHIFADNLIAWLGLMKMKK